MDLAQWLQDSGRRRAIRLEDSPEVVLALMEKHAGRSLRTRDDVTIFFQELNEQEARRQQARTTRRVLRELVLVGALAGAVGQYYFWDISLQISKLPRTYYFVTANA